MSIADWEFDHVVERVVLRANEKRRKYTALCEAGEASLPSVAMEAKYIEGLRDFQTWLIDEYKKLKAEKAKAKKKKLEAK